MSDVCALPNERDRENRKRQTFRTTSQTVKVPASTGDDTSNDGVTGRDVSLPHPQNQPPIDLTRCHLLHSGPKLRNRKTRETHIGIAYGRRSNIQFHSESEQTQRILHTSTAYQFFMKDLRATCDILVRYAECTGKKKRSEQAEGRLKVGFKAVSPNQRCRANPARRFRAPFWAKTRPFCRSIQTWNVIEA